MNYNLKEYSTNINHPAFNKYIKDTYRWSALFSIILAAIIMISFYIYGEISNEMDNPESLFIGLTIGGMFILIAFFQIIGRKKSTTWDGMVVEKKIEKKRKRSQNNNSWRHYEEFTVSILRDHGNIFHLIAEDDDTIYNYYKIGDRVRHHKGLNSYEKRDKSNDTIIFCNACATLNEIADDYCFRCKCPLLK